MMRQNTDAKPGIDVVYFTAPRPNTLNVGDLVRYSHQYLIKSKNKDDVNYRGTITKITEFCDYYVADVDGFPRPANLKYLFEARHDALVTDTHEVPF